MPVDLPKPIAIYIAAENSSPIELQFIFGLEGSKIASLEIRS